MKRIFLIAPVILLIPAAMAADRQLALLEKQAAASFGYWPYFCLTPLAHLSFAALTLLLVRALGTSTRQNLVVGMVLLLVGLVFTFYIPLVITARMSHLLRFGWGEYGEVTRMVGALFAAAGVFHLFDMRRMRDKV